jgi:hypothetical protein
VRLAGRIDREANAPQRAHRPPDGGSQQEIEMRYLALSRACLTRSAAICMALAAFTWPLHAGADDVKIGPIEYQQEVNGVTVNVSVMTHVRVDSVDNKIRLGVRVVGDLSDLQRKIGPIVDSFNLPRNNCGSYSPNNPVVAIPRKELTFRNGTPVFEIGGSVTMWQCVENPVPNSKIEWEIKKIGPIKTKVPVLKTWPGDPIKTILLKQSFEASLPIGLAKHDHASVGVTFSKPDIQLTGKYAFITNGVLQIAGIDINKKAHDALRKAIDPAKLRLAIPEELRKFNPAVESARLFDDAGHLAAEIKLNAEVPAAAMTELIKTLLDRPRS